MRPLLSATTFYPAGEPTTMPTGTLVRRSQETWARHQRWRSVWSCCHLNEVESITDPLPVGVSVPSTESRTS